MAGEMIFCKACGKEIVKDAKMCPHCGKKNKKPVWVILLIIVGVLIVISAISNLLDKPNSGSSSISTSSSSSTTSDTVETKSKSGLEKLSEVAEEYTQYSDSNRLALVASLDLLGYGALKPQILGEYKPKIVKSQYPLQKNGTSYALFGIKVLALKAGESLKASFNYTIVSVDTDQCTIAIEHSDFKSDSDTGPLSVYYFGDWSVFGPKGPVAGQKFLAYVSYHASQIKIGIALPIIVIDGIERK